MARSLWDLFLARSLLLLLLLLLLLASSAKARSVVSMPGSVLHSDLPPGRHEAVSEDEVLKAEDGCRRLETEEECVTKRFMLEHTDYIYTQGFTQP
ncbi:hypothetical protein SAY87_013319 [Trapa incisa]|uniref:Phytosulfokine n=1 Tax=Trapa incisa TaxID=236973 RepID=A0AAN7KGY1_9MYRT|nr:hypothetical protein SAY87_013319 [Trapa incisa]